MMRHTCVQSLDQRTHCENIYEIDVQIKMLKNPNFFSLIKIFFFEEITKNK